MYSSSGEIRTRGKNEFKSVHKSGLLFVDFTFFEEPWSRLGFSEASFETGLTLMCEQGSGQKMARGKEAELEVESQQTLSQPLREVERADSLNRSYLPQI